MESTDQDPKQAQPEQVVRYRVRRAPKYAAFLGLGALLGLLAAVVWTFSRPETSTYSTTSVLGYTGLVLGFLGAMLGGAVAMILDRRR